MFVCVAKRIHPSHLGHFDKTWNKRIGGEQDHIKLMKKENEEENNGTSLYPIVDV